MSDNNNNDPLLDYLNKDNSNSSQEFQHIGNLRKKVDESVLNPVSNVTEYLEAPLHWLPMGKFYKPGTHIAVRPAKVGEIQAFSTMDEANPYDRSVKMTEMLKSTVRVTYADGTIGTYEDVYSFDKLALVVFVSRVTKQKAKALSEKVTCHMCNEENLVNLTPENFEFFQSDEILDEFFNAEIGGYTIIMENGTTINMVPPTIKLEDSLYAFTLRKAAKKEKPNVAFMTVGAWLAPKQNMTDKDWDALLFEFTRMDEDKWDIIDDVMKKGKYGISGLKKKCRCGTEVRADFTFPGGLRGLFATPGALQALVKK